MAIPRPAGAPYRPDPDKVGRGVQGHERTLRALVNAVRARGIEPVLPGGDGPPYDLAWETETTIFVAEVKSLTLANEERQLRLGLGQVLRYWHALSHRTKPVTAVLAVEQKPADETWLALCDRLVSGSCGWTPWRSPSLDSPNREGQAPASQSSPLSAQTIETLWPLPCESTANSCSTAGPERLPRSASELS